MDAGRIEACHLHSMYRLNTQARNGTPVAAISRGTSHIFLACCDHRAPESLRTRNPPSHKYTQSPNSGVCLWPGHRLPGPGPHPTDGVRLSSSWSAPPSTDQSEPRRDDSNCLTERREVPTWPLLEPLSD